MEGTELQVPAEAAQPTPQPEQKVAELSDQALSEALSGKPGDGAPATQTPAQAPAATERKAPETPPAQQADSGAWTPEEFSRTKEEIAALRTLALGVTGDAGAGLRERIGKLEKQIQHKEGFFQRQGQEIGNLRAALKAKIEETQKVVEDKFWENPALAMDAKIEQRQAIEELARVEQMETFRNNANAIHQAIPNFKELVPVMAEIARSDGEPPEVVAAFMANPYVPPPAMLYNLAQRAMMLTKMRNLESEMTKLKTRPEDIVRKIDEAARQPIMTGGSGGATEQTSTKMRQMSDDEIANLSAEELKVLLKQAK